ncbi:MAG TPA: 2-oxo acid dehydrogenase subunit E2 [Acidimicrobiales bacterium]|nr:2-oxo acid dehydrogenase subunit E2 [Acidimicrobiales bacterium]
MSSTKVPISQWRKIAMATWRPRLDGWITAEVDIDARKAQQYVADVRAATGQHVTMMHLVGRAAAKVLEELPLMNGRIVAGRFVPSPTIDVFFTVSMRPDVTDRGEDAAATDLTGAVVRRVDEKPPWEIARELDERARQIREGHDAQFQLTKRVTQLMPPLVLRSFLSLTTVVTEELQLPLPLLGLEARPFGSVLVTNVGTFGLDRGNPPMPAVSRLPAGVAVGAVKDMAVVEDGQVVARPMLPLAVGIDHRFIDGYQAATIAKVFRGYIEDPASFDPVPKRPAARRGNGTRKRRAQPART